MCLEEAYARVCSLGSPLRHLDAQVEPDAVPTPVSPADLPGVACQLVFSWA